MYVNGKYIKGSIKEEYRKRANSMPFGAQVRYDGRLFQKYFLSRQEAIDWLECLYEAHGRPPCYSRGTNHAKPHRNNWRKNNAKGETQLCALLKAFRP